MKLSSIIIRKKKNLVRQSYSQCRFLFQCRQTSSQCGDTYVKSFQNNCCQQFPSSFPADTGICPRKSIGKYLLCDCHPSPDSITDLNVTNIGSERRRGLKLLCVAFVENGIEFSRYVKSCHFLAGLVQMVH